GVLFELYDSPGGPLLDFVEQVEDVEVDGCLRVRACGDGDLVGGCGLEAAELVLEVGPVSGDVVEVVAGVECAHVVSLSSRMASTSAVLIDPDRKPPPTLALCLLSARARTLSSLPRAASRS